MAGFVGLFMSGDEMRKTSPGRRVMNLAIPGRPTRRRGRPKKTLHNRIRSGYSLIWQERGWSDYNAANGYNVLATYANLYIFGKLIRSAFHL